MNRVTLPATILSGFALIAPNLGLAGEAQGGIAMELNQAQDAQSGGCQLTVVVENGSGLALARAAWQIAVFDTQGAVRALPVLDFGALAKDKTKVAMFVLPGATCASTARIVVNDVAECRVEGGENQPDLCLAGLKASTRTSIAFGL